MYSPTIETRYGMCYFCEVDNVVYMGSQHVLLCVKCTTIAHIWCSLLNNKMYEKTNKLETTKMFISKLY